MQQQPGVTGCQLAPAMASRHKPCLLLRHTAPVASEQHQGGSDLQPIPLPQAAPRQMCQQTAAMPANLGQRCCIALQGQCTCRTPGCTSSHSAILPYTAPHCPPHCQPCMSSVSLVPAADELGAHVLGCADAHGVHLPSVHLPRLGEAKVAEFEAGRVAAVQDRVVQLQVPARSRQW